MTLSALYGTAKYGQSYYGRILLTIDSDSLLTDTSTTKTETIDSDSLFIPRGHALPSKPKITDIKYEYLTATISDVTDAVKKPQVNIQPVMTKPKITST